MATFILRRLLLSIPAIVGVVTVIFFLMHASGDPVNFLVSPDSSLEHRAAVRQSYGLDRPLYVQYGLFLNKAVRGDFGESFRYGVPATEVVLERLPASIMLTLASVLVSMAVGLPAGVIAAAKRGSILDNLVMLGAVFGQSIAQFWLALLLIIVFAVKLHWLPTSGMGEGIMTLKHLVLPALTLSPWLTTLVARMARSGMLEVLRQDYIRTAYAKGLSRRLIFTRHALRNALIPIITMAGLTLAWNLGGAVVVEVVFAWPGIGQLTYNSILRSDYNIVLCVVTLIAGTFVFVNLVVDIIAGYIDPRIRLN